jgi:hypothetical protein
MARFRVAAEDVESVGCEPESVSQLDDAVADDLGSIHLSSLPWPARPRHSVTNSRIRVGPSRLMAP